MKTASRQTRLQQKSNVRSQETCKFSKTPIAIVLIFAVNFVQQCLLLKLFFHPCFSDRLTTAVIFIFHSLNLMPSSKFSMVKLRANGLNNSQHYWANNVGSCWVRVDSGVQMHATTPKNGGTFTVHRGKDKSHLKTWETMCNPNNVGRAVQTNPTLLRYPLVIKKHVGVQILRESRYKGSWVEQRFNYSWASWFF